MSARRIFVGIGCRAGVSAEDVRAAIAAALAVHGLEPAQIAAIAAIGRKAEEPGVADAARRLSTPLVAPEDAALRAADGQCLTRSEASLSATGLASASEAAALAAAGPEGRLLGSRLALGPVTCALAQSGNSSP